MKRIDKSSAVIGAAAAVIVGAAGVTYATMANADPSPTPSPGSSATAPRSDDGGARRTNETPLTGDTAAKVKAAVLKKYPGATIHRVETEDAAEGTGGVYEAHITTAAGEHLRVLLDKSFAITRADADGRGGPGRGGPGGHNETELTGATAAKVKAAVLAKLPGATVERMSTEDPGEGTGAAYEAHVTKKDGTHVEVLLNKAFAVIKVTEGRGFGGRHGGPKGGPGGQPPASGSSTESSYTTA